MNTNIRFPWLGALLTLASFGCGEIAAEDTDKHTEVESAASGDGVLEDRDWRLGAYAEVYRTRNGKITQALDLERHGNDIVACFGTWHSPRGWGSYCRSIFGGVEDAGGGGHETAGAGIASGPAGLLVGYEPNLARTKGGIGIFGRGLVFHDSAHYWQAVSVDPRPGRLAIAAAARNTPGDLTVDVFAGRSNGGGSWQHIGSAGQGIAVRQSFISPYHLVFRTGYTSGGSPGLVRVTSATEPANAQIVVKGYSGLPSCAQGIATAELIPNVGLVAGTYSGTLPWRGGNCGHVGVIRQSSLAGGGTVQTQQWQKIRADGLDAADVTDIVPVGVQGMFAVASNFPARVQLFDRNMRVVDHQVFRNYQHAGGLAVRIDGSTRKLYFSVAGGPGRPGDARVYAIDLVDGAPAPAPVITRLYERPDPVHHDEALTVIFEGRNFGAPGAIEIIVGDQVTTVTPQSPNISMTWTDTRIEAVVSTVYTSGYPYRQFDWQARVVSSAGGPSNTVSSQFYVCPRPVITSITSNPQPATRRSALTVSTHGTGFGPAATLEAIDENGVTHFTTASPGVDLLWSEARIDLVIPASFMATYPLGLKTFELRVLDDCGARSNTKSGAFVVRP